jgi:hypothetical protein
LPEQNEALVRLRTLYEAYLDKTAAVERSQKFGAGWFGLKGGVADDPCHDRFADELRAYFEELAQSGADSAAVREVMEYVISAPQTADAPRAAYWMLIAVQGLTQPLLPLLSATDAQTVGELLEKLFPSSKRLPVQDKLLRELRKRAKE